MEGQSVPGNSQYHYQATQWSRLIRRNTVAAVPTSTPPPSIAVTSQLPPHQDLIPIFLPQQSSYHQAQLAQYNRLITAGRISRLQSSPLPPLLSTYHIQAEPGQRTSTSGGITARTTTACVRGGHGNWEPRKPSQGERALVTEKDKAAKMPGKNAELEFQLPIRPHAHHQNTNFSQQSSSVPSTPHQYARKFSYESREPSPNATNNHSPRSAYSESNIPLPPKPHPAKRGGCKYETAMANTRRRIAYSVGDKKLERLDPEKIKSKLSEDEARKLSTDMRTLYDTLLPTPQSDKNRETLVQKLEDMFNGQWPGHDIRVHVFGSSGNMLATDHSDVDICITTEWKEMEAVCMVAELLAKSGMEKVICIPNAKVPIVKMWDPVLSLACDMNVNNPLALENTRMIRTYVQIDPRVRQLAMIVKHWTKQRILNDAAFGCTLSSYTWICMIIFFLQNRNPPILPALHQRPHNKLPSQDGTESPFADDLEALVGFGSENTETLGELLFNFFRYYGHEFDLDNAVVSVRHGKQLTKTEKKWNHGFNNRLCVEEPFNVGRNLGNTADDISFRGLHMELRRAFDLIAEGKLDECCEQYVFPSEERNHTFQRPPQKPKPILRSSTSSNRGGAKNGNHRGGGRHNQQNRNGNSNRRASSGAFDQNSGFIPGLSPNMSQQDAWLQRQAQAQLHNDLFATYSVLQAQENSLRLQLYAQGLQSQAYAQAQGQGQTNGTSSKQHATERNRTASFEQPPLTAPIRPDMYYYPLHYPANPNLYAYQNSTTNPSSPSSSSAAPDLRRGIHRSSVTSGGGMNQGGTSNSASRSQSQPASRSGPIPLSANGSNVMHPGLGIYQNLRPVNGNAFPSFIADENSESAMESGYGSLPPEDPTPKEYVGYYVNDPTQFWKRQQATGPMPIPKFGDLSHARAGPRRLSTEQLPQFLLDRLKRPSRSPSPLGHDRSFSTGAPLVPYSLPNGVSNTNLRALDSQTPIIADGSSPVPLSIPNWQASISEGSISDDRSSDLYVGSFDSLSQASRAGSDEFSDQDLSGQLTPRDVRLETPLEAPVVVNGSTPPRTIDTTRTSTGKALSNGHNLQPINPPTGLLPIEANGQLRLSPGSRNKSARQNGGVSPIDIGLSLDYGRDDLAHLSPVYETRTPSPTANRKFEPAEKTPKSVSVKTTQKHELSNGFLPLQAPADSKINGHSRGSKSEGAPGSWQKIQKGKKKPAASDSKGTGAVQPRGEKLPFHVNERKGG
ncbi:related to polynucleotide adenylyltransferase [Rhynchosporium secalis]|uniref:polynucleotide adenylyltransferase n=1 Tax=Rhynchosporium secalis TaxID=38038 RepID=A0A1E1MNM3_RHYSE|nr:related to polynucleotide adenylyltransferase [Rhynchosporium secalis]